MPLSYHVAPCTQPSAMHGLVVQALALSYMVSLRKWSSGSSYRIVCSSLGGRVAFIERSVIMAIAVMLDTMA